MTPPRVLGIALLVVGLVVVGCSDDDDGDGSPSAARDTGTVTSTTSADEGGGSRSTGASGSTITPEDGELRDGVWAVGDAGTVEFVVGDSGLELVDTAAEDGWDMVTSEESPGEIEVDFVQGDERYDVQVEYENGRLEVEIDHEVAPATPGSFDIGPAGSATVSVGEGDRVTLDDLVVTEGWTVVEHDDDEDGDEAEVELRRDDVAWSLQAEVDDGRFEVQTQFTIAGQFP